MADYLKDYRHRLLLYAERLKGLSPLEKLSHGYAFIQNEAGQAITKIDQVACGDLLKINVQDGHIIATINNTCYSEEYT
jgi:exodeoxyribonuclease VII large subunit